MLPDELAFGGGRPLRGRVRVPGDKSISHRALLFAAIANGRSTLTHLATGEDVGATHAALTQLGVKIRTGTTGTVVYGGGFGGLTEPGDVLDCGNSGTTMRILSGLLAGRPFLSVLTGDASLRERPMARVGEPLRAMGARFDGRDGGGRAPLVIRGGDLEGRRHELAVASAQVKSALVLAGLQARGFTEIVSPAITRDHTERMLAARGAPITIDGLTVRVEPGAVDPSDFEVPGDPSSAAFFVVAATITPGFGDHGRGRRDQPDSSRLRRRVAAHGCRHRGRCRGERDGEPVGDLVVRSAPLTATMIAGAEIPNVQDEVPALAIAAAFADGVTEIRDAAELAVKESNRIGTLHQELTQLGLAVEPRADGLSIRGGVPRARPLKSHGDHRIAMAAAIAANAIDGESTVRGWKAVGSSYPEFAADLAALTSP